MRSLKNGICAVVNLAKPDRNALVVRHNKLIESRHTLTLTERRFMLWIISQIKKDDKVLHTYRVSVKEWAEFCDIKDRNNIYKIAVQMVAKLSTRSTLIHDETKEVYHAFPWFGALSYQYGEGYIEACLNDKISHLFLELSREYTAITLEYALLLNSSYAGRIYDLLKQYQKIGERLISLDHLREILELKNKHKRYQEFRRNVIEVAQREINAKTDIAFDWQAIKEGRKVVAIHFKMRTNTPAVTLDSPEIKDTDTKRIFKRLCRHGVLEQAARDLVADYDAERINWHIAKLEAEIKVGKAIKNPGAWLVEAIKADYRVQKNLFQDEQQAAIKKAAKQRQQAAAIAQAVERIKEETETENMRRTQAKIDSFTDDERAAFDADFLAAMNKGGDFDKGVAMRFENKGLADTLAAVNYRIKIRHHFPEILTTPLEFAKQQGQSAAIIAELKKQQAAEN